MNMKPVKSSAKENKTIGRFTTPQEAAEAKNSGLITSFKKLNLKVVASKPFIQQAK